MIDSETGLDDINDRRDQEIQKLIEADSEAVQLGAGLETVAQVLYSISLVVETAQRALRHHPERLPELLQFICEQAETGIEESRKLNPVQ